MVLESLKLRISYGWQKMQRTTKRDTFKIKRKRKEAVYKFLCEDGKW